MRILYLLSPLMLLMVSGCEVEVAPSLDHYLFHEDESKGQMEMNLTWTVNGVKDDGMIADLSIYLSPSNYLGADEMKLDEALERVRISSFDYYGGTRLAPSNRSLFDLYRYFIGVAFNGILPGSQPVTYPLTINYTLNIFLENEPDGGKVITGEFVIANANLNTTKVEYQHSMDILDSEPEAEFRSYSFRALEAPILLSRASDVQNTSSFPSDKTLYIEMVWKVNGEVQGYNKTDLDLFLHDINDTNVQDFGDLDQSSAREDSYERMLVDPANTFFNSGVPEKLGFYFYDNTIQSPLFVEYMYKIYSYGTNIKRFTAYGSFTSPPVAEDDGSFYFGVDILKNGTTYQVTKLGTVVQWRP